MNERVLEKSVLQAMRRAEYSIDAAKERSIPVYYKDVARKSMVSILEEYVMLWEPRDLRLDPAYQETHAVEVTDDALIQDIAKGMKLKVEERIPSQNTIKVAVLFQHNLSEFERYNDVVDAHNERWVEQGCPEDVFNPETGDVFEVEDRYLNRAGDDSPNPFGESTGRLASAKPKARRRKLLTIIYRLDVLPESRMFNLEFSAEDYQGRVVYYNKLKGKNLAYLTRRATQELYGNPEAYGNTGPFYEGISMLVTGKKLRRCASKNDLPGVVTEDNNFKESTFNQASMAAGVSGLKTVGYMIRYTIPTFGLFFLIIRTFIALSAYSLDGLFPAYLITIGLMYASVIISGQMLRKAYSLEVERKFT